MTNELSLLIYTPLFVIALILLANTCRKDMKDYAVRQYLYFCICLTGWFVCEMLYYLLEDPFLLRYVFELKLAFVAFIAVSIFFTVAGFYRLNRSFPKWLPLVLCVIPAITTILALLDPFHTLLLKSYQVVELAPLVRAENQLGIWYYVHTVYSQGLAVSIFVILLRNYRMLPRAYRSGSTLMLAGTLLYFICTCFGAFGLERNVLDYNLIGLSVGGLFYHLASLVKRRPNYLHIERREVFHYLDVAVLILNKEGFVIDINVPGRNFLRSLGIQKPNIHFDGQLDQLISEGKICRRATENPKYEDLSIQNGRFQLVYEMQRQPYYSEETQDEGSFIMLTDVTNNRLFIERLRELAGFDPLTGLPNRYGYLERLRQLDTKEMLPLSIVVGDVNGLKEVNDNFGHSQGDSLLQSVAEILQTCCPAEGYVARMGGDEFIMLLPRCTHEKALGVIAEIQACMSRIFVGEDLVSIALGCTTKQSVNENINQLVNEADTRMYHDKNHAGTILELGLKERSSFG